MPKIKEYTNSIVSNESIHIKGSVPIGIPEENEENEVSEGEEPQLRNSVRRISHSFSLNVNNAPSALKIVDSKPRCLIKKKKTKEIRFNEDDNSMKQEMEEKKKVEIANRFKNWRKKLKPSK